MRSTVESIDLHQGDNFLIFSGISFDKSTCKHCVVACTPASVLPLPTVSISERFSIFFNTSFISP